MRSPSASLLFVPPVRIPYGFEDTWKLHNPMVPDQLTRNSRPTSLRHVGVRLSDRTKRTRDRGGMTLGRDFIG